MLPYPNVYNQQQSTAMTPGLTAGNRKETNFEPNKTLFLGDLSYFCTEDDLFNLFSAYGPINTIRVQRGVSGEPLLHGYVVFHNPMSARQALMDMDGLAFMGRNLRIQLGTVNHHNKEKLGFSDSKNFTQIHVSFICKRGRGFVVNEQVLRDIFTPFGQIADVAIKKHSRNPKQQRQTGYGFIYFVNAEDACRAVIALKNTTLHDITFDCNISHKSEHMIRSMLEPCPPAPPAAAVPAQPIATTSASYSIIPPAVGGNYGNGGRYSAELEYNSRILGPRGVVGYNPTTNGYGVEGVTSLTTASAASCGLGGGYPNTTAYASFSADYQDKVYSFSHSSDPLQSTLNPTLPAFTPLNPFAGVDSYLSAPITSTLPTAGGSLKTRSSPFEFGRELAEFDTNTGLANLSPSPVLQIPEFIPSNFISSSSPSGGLNTTTNTANTNTVANDGMTTNSAGSPKGEKQVRNNSLKSTSSNPDHQLEDSLLYSFQALSLPSEEKASAEEKSSLSVEHEETTN